MNGLVFLLVNDHQKKVVMLLLGRIPSLKQLSHFAYNDALMFFHCHVPSESNLPDPIHHIDFFSVACIEFSRSTAYVKKQGVTNAWCDPETNRYQFNVFQYAEIPPAKTSNKKIHVDSNWSL